MDFETELGFYTMSFILVCFRLLLLYSNIMQPVLRSAGWLWARSAGSGRRRGRFKRGDRVCLPHTRISTPAKRRAAAAAAAALTGLQEKGEGGEGGEGALLQGTVRVNTLSLLPPSYPEVWWLQRTQVGVSAEALGGGRKTWKSSVEAR